MRYLIECDNGERFEVTNLYKKGEPTELVSEATHMIIKLAEDSWQVMEIGCGKVHTLQ